MPPDRRRDLEDELRDLGPRVEYPPTPDLAGSVKNRLDAGDGPSASATSAGPSLWWMAAAAALVLLVVVPVLSLSIRGGMGAGGMAGGAAQGNGGVDAASSGEQAAGGGSEEVNEPVTSMQGEQAGSAAAGAASVASGEAATAYPAQSGSESAAGSAPHEGVYLGERITLREARARSEAPLLVPRSPRLGEPDEVYGRGFGPGFVLLYRPGPGLPDLRVGGVGKTGIGLLLTQTRGDVGGAYLASGTARGEDLETASVKGGRAYWVPSGERRLTVARDAGPSTSVLLWERDGQALRIEADVAKEEALRIAESVR